MAVIQAGKGALRWDLENICKTAAPSQGLHPYSLFCLSCWPGIRVEKATGSQGGRLLHHEMRSEKILEWLGHQRKAFDSLSNLLPFLLKLHMHRVSES